MSDYEQDMFEQVLTNSNPTVPTCPWWSRWWHRRKRRIDREVMIPAIDRQCQRNEIARGSR